MQLIALAKGEDLTFDKKLNKEEQGFYKAIKLLIKKGFEIL